MVLREFTEQELISLYPAFLLSLQDRLEYLSDGGTEYRIVTAQISCKVAEEAGIIIPFMDKKDAKATVLRILGGLDRERLNDVSKMLVTTANNIKIEAFRTEDAREYLDARKLKRLNNPIKLKRLNNPIKLTKIEE